MTIRSLFVAGLLAVTVIAPVRAQESQPLDGIAAVVNEDVVLKSELDRAVANVQAQYASNPGQLPPPDVLRRQVLERLVLVKLQVARAQENGISVSDEEVNSAVASVAQQNNTTVDGLRQRLAAEGLSFDEFRSSLRDEITVQRLRQSYGQSRIRVSEAEVDAALKAQANGGVQYHLAHILIGLPEGATAEQIATGQKKAEGVKSLLDRNEMDFSAAAVRYSDSPNALEGGDLGWRSLDEIPVAFVDTLKNMQAGQVVGPIRGPSGFQLLKLVETRDASQAPSQMTTEYHARHILVRVTPVQDAAAAKAKIDTLRARIAGGADFAELAKADSEDANTKNDGGDLGWFTADQFGPDFGQRLTALKDGEVSEPFRTEAGWHIVQREGTRQTDVTDQNRRAQVRDTIGRRKLEEEYNRYLLELRGEAYVSFRTGDAAIDSATPDTAMSAPGAAEEAAKAGKKQRGGDNNDMPGSASSNQMP
ncbi:peptidylprolyl isomerase [Pseudoxanthomonas sp. X-1]|uniref:peptidylprolyl isomerase n=1 Tax=Pseudoxanthomonas sp. X-1 TaxID=2571115 RepID=UPI000DB2CE82|nr:peptidylprolyl isomerase [Pseudoxanthomonas sp. X-1]PZP59879.1 MAG: molecular chaperone SurA [Pseudoxanthomonas spadix]TMN20290.1 molecular chaperone SurA [Pseudoxanthomonas sp. X-1]UAY73518.1 peptidylprolyl isomerase [Pseudoxanthomonas sp. X-1]